MTKPIDDPTRPSTKAVPYSPSQAMNADGAAGRAHWSRGALNGAGKLITTAANDQLVRNMIGNQARSQVAATVFGGTIMGAIAARVATRSVPGALLVGGALLAKAIYDQRKAKSDEAAAAKLAGGKAQTDGKTRLPPKA